MSAAKKIAFAGVFSAMAVLLVVLPAPFRFSIFPAVSFLEYDFADIPILISAFLFGPWMGLAVTAVTALVQGVTVSAQAGIIGIIMHIISSGMYVLVAGLIYRHRKTKKSALLGLGCGALTVTLAMTLWNLLITPLYMGVPRGVVVDLLGFIVAFNLIKTCGNGLLTFLLYKRVSKLVKHF
ncbi:MAG: ECF transporter S component [Clostridia bacterium]|nr:ECF transporter S component [Clostridia bacterium]